MFQSEVTLVHICDPESHNGFEMYVRCSPTEIAEEQAARRNLDSFLAAEFPPGATQRILLSGDAATQIAEVARTGKFDLIVMPTHSGRFRRMLLGSTTAKVLNDAACPVLTTEHCVPTGDRHLCPKARTHLRISPPKPVAAWTQRACPQINNSCFQSNHARQHADADRNGSRGRHQADSGLFR